MNQKFSAIGVLFAMFLIVTGFVVIGISDQIIIGIGLLSLGLIIILIKIMWGISVWADDTLNRWSKNNLEPKEDFEISFEEKKDG